MVACRLFCGLTRAIACKAHRELAPAPMAMTERAGGLLRDIGEDCAANCGRELRRCEHALDGRGGGAGRFVSALEDRPGRTAGKAERLRLGVETAETRSRER